jgi:hypothetical protein
MPLPNYKLLVIENKMFYELLYGANTVQYTVSKENHI